MNVVHGLLSGLSGESPVTYQRLRPRLDDDVYAKPRICVLQEEEDMGVRRLARAVLVGTVAVALGSLPVVAQTVTYQTSGAFSGTGCTAVSCVFGGFTLSYNSSAIVTAAPPVNNVDMGQFTLFFGGGTNPATIPGDVVFTLTVNQTVPSVGSGNFVGSVSGTIGWNPASGSLVWSPTSTTLNIGAVTYQLVTDNTGKIGIVLPTPNAGENPNTTSIKANLTVTPEPSTVALMATGMFGLIPVIRRRRKE
jgi:hypothetical protein